jgi:1,4-alpha-glucan branching enzyme
MNAVYKESAALWEQDNVAAGFEWLDGGNSAQNVVAFVRWSKSGDPLVGIFNFSGTPIGPYRVGLPFAGTWDEVINTDAVEYGGSGVGNFGSVTAQDEPHMGRQASVELTLPPLGGLWLKPRK